MPEVSFDNLLIVSVVALLAPLALGYLPGLRIPAVVLEIVAGVVLGPSVLGWVTVDLPIQILAIVGLAMLLFLAGLEVDVHRLAGRPLALAAMGYGITLVVGLGFGLAFAAAGWVSGPALLAVTLSATSLGLVVPVLKDAGQADRPVGQLTIAAASVADFAAILLLSLFFSVAEGSTAQRLAMLGLFVAVIVAIGLAGSTARRSMRLGDVLVRLQDTTAEIRVRAAVALLIGFVALAAHLGLETILGAFLAGAVVGLLDRDAASHPHLRTKLEAIGFGFLIPVFFVSSGVRLDLAGLLADPAALLRVPLFLLALLAARGLAALPYLRSFGPRATAAAGLLQATSLPFIVTATQIGVGTGRMTPVTAAALVTAGLIAVMVFPATALGLLRTSGGPVDPDAAAAPDGGSVAPAGGSAAPAGGSAAPPDGGSAPVIALERGA
jgi:Kef-type K+ transport system membrane component KefB